MSLLVIWECGYTIWALFKRSNGAWLRARFVRLAGCRSRTLAAQKTMFACHVLLLLPPLGMVDYNGFVPCIHVGVNWQPGTVSRGFLELDYHSCKREKLLFCSSTLLPAFSTQGDDWISYHNRCFLYRLVRGKFPALLILDEKDGIVVRFDSTVQLTSTHAHPNAHCNSVTEFMESCSELNDRCTHWLWLNATLQLEFLWLLASRRQSTSLMFGSTVEQLDQARAYNIHNCCHRIVSTHFFPTFTLLCNIELMSRDNPMSSIDLSMQREIVWFRLI